MWLGVIRGFRLEEDAAVRGKCEATGVGMAAGPRTQDGRESRVKKLWSLRGHVRDFVFYPTCKPLKV